MSSSKRARAFLSLVVFASLAAVLPSLPLRAQMSMVGKTSVDKPAPSDAGDWPGTWFYASRVRRMALWMREQGGKPQVMLQMQGKGHASETFSTGWDGKADYEVGGMAGKFELQLTRADANAIEGKWIWEWGTPIDGKRETADFSIYRTGDGRQIVWLFKNYHEKHWGAAQYELTHPEMLWTFRKASRHQALWGELPF